MSITERWTTSLAATEDTLETWSKDGGSYFVADQTYLMYGNIFYFTTLTFLYFFMKNREPYDLKPFMRVYNLTCVLLAGATAYITISYKLSKTGTTFMCNAPDRFSDEGRLLAFGSQLFYYQKFWEFLDSFIFMLRKKMNQVSFLHVYHHSSITVIVALYASIDSSGDCYLGVMLNSCVHVLMYLHYFVTSLGVKSTPWKPYITQMQLIQFCIIMYQSIAMYFNGSACGFPDWLKIVMIGYMASMLVLFGRFYVAAYLTPKTKKEAKKE